MNLKILFSLLFFLSGATSLILQIVWTKELSYILGNSLYAVSTVVAAFMGGLALGSYAYARYWRGRYSGLWIYVIFQFAIALFSFASVYILRSSDTLLALVYTFAETSSFVFLLSRFLMVFLMILVPVTMMGGTLPAIIDFFSQQRSEDDGTTGLFYGFNTLGAALGVIVAGFVLIPMFGLLKTSFIAGGLDAVVGILGLLLIRQYRLSFKVQKLASKKVALSTSLTPHARVFLFLYFWVGFLLIGAEVYWYRVLSNILGPFEQCYSMILCLFLFGIGSGSYFYTILDKRFKNTHLILWSCTFFILFFFVSSLYILPLLSELNGMLFLGLKSTHFASLVSQGAAAALLVFPTTFCSGILFPAFIKVLNEKNSGHWSTAKMVGYVYAVNTLGSIIGSLTVGYLLLPHFGLGNTLVIFMLIAVVLTLGFAFQFFARWPRLRFFAPVVLFFVALVCILKLPALDRKMLNRGGYMVMSNPGLMYSTFSDQYDQGRDLLFFEDGLLSSVSVESFKNNIYLRLAGKPEAGSQLRLRSHHVLLAQLPLMLAKEVKDVAVVGLGAGFTAGSVLIEPQVKSVDVLEIEPSVVKAAKFFNHLSHFSKEDPRVRVLIEDARTHFKYSQKQYDIITSDPVSPVFAGTSNLYTIEYYQLLHDRLKEGGVFAQWIDSSFISVETFKSIASTARKVFPHLVLYIGGDELMMVASNTQSTFDWSQIEQRFAQGNDSLRQMGITTPYLLFQSFLSANESLKDYLSDTQKVNTDDQNWLGDEVTRELLQGKEHRLTQNLYKAFAKSTYDEMAKTFVGFSIPEFQKSIFENDLDIYGSYKHAFLEELRVHESSKKPAQAN